MVRTGRDGSKFARQNTESLRLSSALLGNLDCKNRFTTRAELHLRVRLRRSMEKGWSGTKISAHFLLHECYQTKGDHFCYYPKAFDRNVIYIATIYLVHVNRNLIYLRYYCFSLFIHTLKWTRFFSASSSTYRLDFLWILLVQWIKKLSRSFW